VADKKQQRQEDARAAFDLSGDLRRIAKSGRRSRVAGRRCCEVQNFASISLVAIKVHTSAAHFANERFVLWRQKPGTVYLPPEVASSVAFKL